MKIFSLILNEPASLCKDCAVYTNATEDRLRRKCNCLQPKPEKEKCCPYYVPSQNN